MTNSAEKFLKHVANVITERSTQYGDASGNMAAIAARWSATLGHKITPAQVVLCLLDLKLARLARDPAHEDSAIDVCGYAALLTELTKTPEQEGL
jgi:hypothetical protein